MKRNMKELFRIYHKLPISIDTESQRQRKIRLEQEIDKLEKDIEFMENNPLIYVCED